MSAIYGVYHLEKRKENVLERMQVPLCSYKIDAYSHKEYKMVSFGCGIQYFTQEATKEVLPYLDEEKRIIVTADVVLDNRKEVMQGLGIELADMPDGELVFRAYVSWGEAFVKYLRGVFSIAIYDDRKQSLYLYTDHTGSRSVYYYMGEDGFYFSSIFAPILQVNPQITLCEKWITACEAARTPDMALFPEITPYEGVIQLEAGCYIKVGEQSFEKVCYWNPAKNRQKITFQDGQCASIFKATFRQCVKDVLRSNGEVAAMVSSGLDSTAVACLAAQYLEEEKKQLYSYTSVPEGDFQSEDYGMIANESWGPEELAKKYSNIQVNLVDCEGMDGFTKLKQLVPLLELPTKSAPNMMWIDEIYKEASEKGCRLLLKGQFGNGTISYGKILSLLHDKFTHFHFIQGIKELYSFGKRNGVSKKRIIKTYFRELKKKKEVIDFEADSYVRRELLQKYAINEKVAEEIRKNGGGNLDTRSQMEAFIFDKVNCAQLGAYDTRLSLIHGMLVRDPTKDKRIIELCMSLPMECFVHDGVERRLVREYMQGIVPNEILSVVKRRGQQSADYVERIQKNWKEKKEEIIQRLSNPRFILYFDDQKLEVFLHKLQNETKNTKEELRELYAIAMNLYAFSVFLEYVGNEKM